jgi:hypothetical protein
MAAGDLFWDTVAIAMHMDDAGLTCEKGTALTLNGGVTRSATQSKFGGYSAYFDGVDDEILEEGGVTFAGVSTSFQFFCRPDTQVAVDPCILKMSVLSIEYKPTGCPYGFAVNINGTRTQCGVQPEGAWYYFWCSMDAAGRMSVYIDGILVFNSGVTYPSDSTGYALVSIGSANLTEFPDTAFKGYIDDLLITNSHDVEPIEGHTSRWDYSVPIAAFLNRLPDPEGEAVGSMVMSGTMVGMVPPIGVAYGALRLIGTVAGLVPCAGSVTGRVRYGGLGEGVVGRTGFADGPMRFSGSALGYLGMFGSGYGRIRFSGAGVAKHGVSCVASGPLRLTGAAVGSTPEWPVGTVSGKVRFAGYAVGTGGVVDTDCD